MSQLPSIGIEQLRVGIYIHLDLKWSEHPFFTNNFKIRNAEQIETLRHLGLRNVHYDPRKSDCKPAPAASESDTTAASAAATTPHITAEEIAAITAKVERVQRLMRHRESVQQCEEHLLLAAGTVRSINQNLFCEPLKSLQMATELVSGLADAIAGDQDVAIHALNNRIRGEDLYQHSLNVAVLSMLVARQMGLSRAEVGQVGMGALLHDIGTHKLPDAILRKGSPLTAAEKNLMAMHPIYGEDMARSLKLPQAVIDIIRQHHEHMDGSGYPDHLKSASISPLSRIVSVVEAYEGYCNPVNPQKALTPFEAISTMFARQRTQFDPVALGRLIHILGVYPPGTLVRLSNDMWGLVVSVNANNPVKPVVRVYEEDVPREEAIILDLDEHADISVKNPLRPEQLPPEVRAYLSPPQRVTYYFNTVPGETAQA